MPFQPKKNATVSGPHHTGSVQGLSAEEQQIAQQEASQSKAPMGQAEANAFFQAVAGQVPSGNAVPEQILHGASVDPQDYADSPNAQKGFIGRSGFRERFGPDMAIGGVSPQMRKDYGIRDDEFVSWCLQDNYAGGGRNFEDEWMQNNPDGRIPRYVGSDKDKEGEKCRMQGMVLTAMPMAVWEEISADNKRIVQERQDLIDHGNPDLPSDNLEVTRMRDENTRSIRKLLEGSPTYGIDFDAAKQMMGDERTAAITEKYLYMHTAQRPTPNPAEAAQAQANAVDRAVETAKAQSTGRTSFAVQGFRDRNK